MNQMFLQEDCFKPIPAKHSMNFKFEESFSKNNSKCIKKYCDYHFDMSLLHGSNTVVSPTIKKCLSSTFSNKDYSYLNSVVRWSLLAFTATYLPSSRICFYKATYLDCHIQLNTFPNLLFNNAFLFKNIIVIWSNMIQWRDRTNTTTNTTLFEGRIN